MKYWSEILDVIPVSEFKYEGDFEVQELNADSRSIKKGDVFIAIKGLSVDGHNYIDKAIENGASAIIGTDRAVLEGLNVPWVLIEEDQFDPSKIASRYYDNPSASVKVMGVTGTNGKTTIVTLLFGLFRKLNQSVGMISTVENRVNDVVIPSTHTTPDAVSLQRLFAQMVDVKVEYVFMEVSSHAVNQGRVANVDFDVAVFTNLSHDHLDYHKTFSNYRDAKKAFFDGLNKDAIAIVNLDDKNGAVMVQNTKAQIRGYALQQLTDYKARILSNTVSGLHMLVNDVESYFKISGSYNAYNLLAAYAVACEFGFDHHEVLVGLSGLMGTRGRLEKVIADKINFSVYVDYAHTPDALKNVMQTLNDLIQDGGRLITVVGCGGNRDRTKRPEMAKIGVELGSFLIITSDNPRDEDPDLILDEMEEGVDEFYKSRYLRIRDRAAAIRAACMIANKDDIVLVAGKGHENYQEVKGEKKPFDDKEIVKATLLKI